VAWLVPRLGLVLVAFGATVLPAGLPWKAIVRVITAEDFANRHPNDTGPAVSSVSTVIKSERTRTFAVGSN
jgi:hypothetical protein